MIKATHRCLLYETFSLKRVQGLYEAVDVGVQLLTKQSVLYVELENSSVRQIIGRSL